MKKFYPVIIILAILALFIFISSDQQISGSGHVNQCSDVSKTVAISNSTLSLNSASCEINYEGVPVTESNFNDYQTNKFDIRMKNYLSERTSCEQIKQQLGQDYGKFYIDSENNLFYCLGKGLG